MSQKEDKMQCDVFRGSCVPRLRRRCSCAGARQGLCRGAPHGIVPAGGLRTAPRRGAHSGSQAWGQGLKQHFFFFAFWGYNKFKKWESVHNPAWTSWAGNLALGRAFALLSAVVYLL